jgi:hypothetical protein
MLIGKFSAIALCLLALCGNGAAGTITVTVTSTLTQIFSTSDTILGTADATFVLDPSLLSAPNDTETITDFSLDVDIFSSSLDLESVNITPDSTTPCYSGAWTCFPSANALVDSSGQGITVSIVSLGCLDYGSFLYPAPYCAYPTAYQLFLSYPSPFSGNELIPAPPGANNPAIGPGLPAGLLGQYDQIDPAGYGFDNVVNGSSAVGAPEPSSIVLMGCGVAAFAFFWLRRSHA